ncbi:MAG TPA: apolipoprotein N-acyltransferase [Acidimicrobiales bacterium]|nr:apolipoprotein N-acyltransferase [Acidimicrobiales bacterium]
MSASRLVVDRARWARRLRVAGPSALAGLLMALSIPPWGFWILAFPAAALLWWRLDGLPVGLRLLAGYVAGLGLYVPSLWWAVPFNVYGGIIMMLLLGIGPAVACALAPPGRGRTFALAGAMVLLEMLRDRWPFGGMPLGGIALGQVAGPLGATARIGGQFLVLGLVWVLGGGLGALALAAARAWRARRAAHREAAGWQALADHAATVGSAAERGGVGGTIPEGVVRGRPARVGGMVAAGLAAVASVVAVAALGTVAPDGGPAVGTVQAAAVQGGGVRGLRKAQVDPTVVYVRQLEASSLLPPPTGAGPPRLVLWPEDVVALDQPLVGSPQAEALGNLAVSLGASLLVGVTEPAPGRHFLNEVVAFGPDGRIVAHYEKVHRVPFGEYVPARSFFEHLADLSGVPLDAVPGHGDGVLRTPAATVGAMVSYEVFFPDRARIPVRAGAELLVVPTNTSSYATTQVPTQEIAASRLRAIEEGRDLVQAAPAGYSAVIDNHGTVHAISVLGRRQVLVRSVALRRGLTVYGHVGDLLAFVASIAALAGGWLASMSQRDERRDSARAERAATAERRAERERVRQS